MGTPDAANRILDLPEMVPASLTRDGVERFFTDLAFETTLLGILLRAPSTPAAGAPAARGEAVAPNLRVARDALLSGEVRGVQLRYVHSGTEWWDTLLRTVEGFRVVRVRKPPEGKAPESRGSGRP